MALRYHVSEGNAKWVSLLLWAGADPWKGGPYDPGDLDTDPAEDDDHLSAIDLAVLDGKVDILNLKAISAAIIRDRARAARLISGPCHVSALSWLLERGIRPDVLDDKGTAAIGHLLRTMSWRLPSTYDVRWHDERSAGIDTSDARERLKMIHMLVVHGAKWLPADKGAITDARRALLTMSLDYVLEFVWLMQKYQAARRADVEALLRAPAMVRLIAPERQRLGQITAGLPDEVKPQYPMLQGDLEPRS